MQIVSRKNEDQVQKDRLRGIIHAATDGNVMPANTMPKLVDQVEDTVMSYMEAVEDLEQALDATSREVAGLDIQCTILQNRLEGLTQIGFDEALDYATLDLMDALLGSGAATSTFAGDLAFEPDVTFTKQDLKPLLRQAIITWVNTKVNN